MFLKRYFKGIIFLVLPSLNKLDAATKGAKRFSNPQALSSALAALGMLQPRAFELLNRLVLLVLASNYYYVYLKCKLHYIISTSRIISVIGLKSFSIQIFFIDNY